MRFVISVAMAGLLAACSLGATTPSENSLPPIGESSSGASASESAMTSAACVAAFDSLSVDPTSLGSLDAVVDELDSTISACATVDDWEAAAESALPGLDLSDPQEFLAARCAENATLSTSLICAEVAS